MRLLVPQRGGKKELQATGTRNATEEFTRHRLRRASDHNSRAKALNELQDALGLPEAPLRIGVVVPTGSFATEVQTGVNLAVAASNDAKAAGAKRPTVEVLPLNDPAPAVALELAARKKQVAGIVVLATEGDAADRRAARSPRP